MEEILKKHLIETYNPIGIILHGSRAGGYATEHSDWDFFVFTIEEIQNKRKHVEESIDGQFLDIMIWQFPINEADLKNYFGKYCGYAKLLYSSIDLVNEMFIEAKEINKIGKKLTLEEYTVEKRNIEKEIQRLEDWKTDTTGVFYLRISDLYKKFYELWWIVKNKKFSVSPRKGLNIIKEEDIYFFNLLTILSSHDSNENQYTAIMTLKEYIFTHE